MADHVTRLLGLALTVHVIVTLEPTSAEYSLVVHVTTGATARHTVIGSTNKSRISQQIILCNAQGLSTSIQYSSLL